MKYKVFKVVEEIHCIEIEANSASEAEAIADKKISSVDWKIATFKEERVLYGQTEFSDDNQ